MIDAKTPNRERLDHLLADRALFGLSKEEHAELESLLPRFDGVDPHCFERTAACIDLAIGGGRFSPMPDAIREKVRQQAVKYLADNERHAAQRPAARQPAPAATESTRLPARFQRLYREPLAWIVAAAAVAAAVVMGSYPRGSDVKPPSVAELRGQLIDGSDDLLRVNWQATEDAAGKEASGDVLWSNAQQCGYMRFCKLLENDPKQSQYQLWIFDAERDDRYPVDGGVFDIGNGQEEVIVPIRAKLNVLRPVMFAVTVEKPGGVVVSSRRRICLLAKSDG